MAEHKVVIGLGFGDEGKGVLTDYLCGETGGTVSVVRFSGGHQAGHTVEFDGIRHVFSNFGSGSLRGIPTIWSQFCTVDPVGICREAKVLRSKGVNPVIWIDPACPITTPYDKFANMNSTEIVKHGSCGVGFGKTIEREERLYSLLVGDLFYKNVFAHKLAMIAEYYREYNAKYEVEFLEACSEMMTLPGLQVRPYSHTSANTYIYEGSQGLMLDKNIGFFPHVTRSNTDLTNTRKLGVGNPAVMFVTRCYQTRHGNGPMTNEGLPHNIIRDPKETNVTHKYQGEFRISMLDMDLIEYAISRVRPYRYQIAVTCLEHTKDDLYFYTRRGEMHTAKGALGLRTAFMNVFQNAEHVLMFKNHQKVNI